MANLSTDVIDAEWYDEVPRSIRTHVIAGLSLLIVSFGGFGWWAFSAPLAAAVITQGSFVATGRNKIVQHFEGGIIKEIMVTEGEYIAAGTPILVLDETAALANERELFLRQTRLEATEARILAEHDQVDSFEAPAHLRELRADFEVASILDGQVVAFNASMQGLRNDISLLERNMEALGVRSTGYEHQLRATRMQKEILEEELAAKTTLFEKGLLRRVEVSSIRRALAEVDGQIGRLFSEVAEIEQIRQKHEMQIEQTLSESRRAALDELQVVQAELDGIREQMRKAQNVLKRAVIVAPVSGTVIRLHYHTAGGVIESGKAIAEILPADEPLIIEAQVPRTEIDSVKEGQEATVRLTALNQRITPVLDGTVFYVSADAIVDRSQEQVQEVYVARVSIATEELDRVRGFTPTPGMPVEIMIQTAERTFFQYLAKPITDSMTRAFREQ